MAIEEQLNSILDCVLLIEDKEVRWNRMNAVDPHILLSVAPSVMIIAFHSYFNIINLSL